MNDYIYLAQKDSIPISDKMYDETIKNFSLNKENNFIRVEMMSGKVDFVSSRIYSLDELSKAQEESFNEIRKKVTFHSNLLTGIKLTFIALNAFVATNHFMNGNVTGGVCFSIMGTSLLLNNSTYKIRKEMNLVSWVLKNRDQVDAMIKEEVEKFRIPKEQDLNTLNPIQTYEYPSSDVIYPKEMYEEGINLNNIENLCLSDLKLIKKKTKKRNKNISN